MNKIKFKEPLVKLSKAAQLVIGVTSGVVSLNALATPISIEGTATSENAIAIGTDSFATAVNGVANGKGAVATGKGFSREDFETKAKEQDSLLNDKANKQNELNSIDTNLEVNDKAQGNLNNQINELTNLVDRSKQKIRQLENLEDSLNKQNDNLSDLQKKLSDAKTRLPNEYLTGENKNVSVDFTPILNSLDYNKLNNADGRTELSKDLKNKLETDFPDVKGMFTDKEYLNVLNEFVSKRSSYDAYRNVYDSEMGDNKYKSISVDSINTGEALENIYLRHGESVTNVARNNIYTRLENDKENHTYANYQDNNYLSDKQLSKSHWEKLGRYESMQTRLYDQLIVSSIVANPSTSSHFIANQYTNGECNSRGGKAKDCYNTKLTYVFKLAPLNDAYNENNRFKFIDKYIENESSVKDGKRVEGIRAVVQRIITDKAVSNNDLEYIKHYYDQFNTYSNSIDYNSDKWIVDKDNYRSNLQKVLDFNAKLEEYRQLSEQIRNDAMDNNVKDALLAQQINLKKEIEALNVDSSYFDTMSVSFNQAGKNEVNQGIDYVIKQENFIDQNLRYYDGKNVIITKIQEKIKEVQKEISDAQQAVDNKQREIDGLNKHIKDLTLTPDEQGAADLKRQKEQELADKKAEKTQLEQDKSAKQAELDEINRKINETGLANLGKNSTALGANAFASGDDSIAIGTNATVTSNDGIAIGRNSNVTGKQSIGLGAENTVSGDKSIAIGVGHTVSGNRSSTIGDPNTITGDDVFVAGNNNNVASNNVMVMGNNVTVGTGFDGAVVLGNGSTVNAANPTASYEIKGTTYNFAGGNPTSVVSVGASGQERQITNVAAGRIAETSTDAINGSQLYALAAAIAQKTVTPADVSDEVTNQLETKLVGGDNITIDKDDATNTFTITGKNTQSVVVAGQGVSVDAQDNAIGTKDYTVSAKLGEGLAFDDNGAIKANGTKITAGENVEVTGDATNGYTITAKTQIINGGKATVVHAGDNVQVTGDVDNGFTVSVENMRTTVTGGDGAEVTASDNTDGSKNYTVKVKAGDGLTYDENGNVVNDLKLTAGDNVQITGDAKTGYTVSATDTNTQSTVTAGQGITVKAADNAIGTKDYTVEAKLGKGLKIDENGAIAATAQPINGGNGVTVTTNAQDESVVDVVGVTTSTDDGKSYTRSDLTKAVGVKGDGKNIRTTTATNGDVQVRMSDDIQINSVTVNNGPTINQNGINANNTRVTNVQDGVAPTDAVNVRQLNEHSSQVNNRINQVEGNLRKQNKMRKAGHASALATAGLMQAHREGQSGVTAAVGQYQGQTAVAVGYSRLSDNGKYGVKLSLNANTQKEVGGTVGVGYFW